MATIPVLLPGKSRGQRRLAGYSSWGLLHSQTRRLSNETTKTLLKNDEDDCQTTKLDNKLCIGVGEWSKKQNFQLLLEEKLGENFVYNVN